MINFFIDNCTDVWIVAMQVQHNFCLIALGKHNCSPLGASTSLHLLLLKGSIFQHYKVLES